MLVSKLAKTFNDYADILESVERTDAVWDVCFPASLKATREKGVLPLQKDVTISHHPNHPRQVGRVSLCLRKQARAVWNAGMHTYGKGSSSQATR